VLFHRIASKVDVVELFGMGRRIPVRLVTILMTAILMMILMILMMMSCDLENCFLLVVTNYASL